MTATPRNCDRCLQDSPNTTTVCFGRKSKKSFIMCERCLNDLAEYAAPLRRAASFDNVYAEVVTNNPNMR